MKQQIENHLVTNPSYFKWSEQRLANKFNCSPKTIRGIVRKLEPIRQNYLRSL